MKLVLDTNAFVQRKFRLDGPHISILKEAISKGFVELVVPEIIVEETINKYRENLIESLKEVNKKIDALNSILAGSQQIQIPSINIENEVQTFITSFDRLLHELRAARPSYKEIPQEDIVRRDLKRRRPFQESGKGYRDALLWETLLRNTLINGELCILVTNNTKDFCSQDSDLHPHLVDDLTERNLSKADVNITRTLSEFIDQKIKPCLPTNKDIISAIQNDTYRKFKFSEFYGENREKISSLLNVQLDRLNQLNLPAELESPTVLAI
ncbi:MAG: DUF4935 domain-containing protein [Gammaproteobacteria bacterium]|nr:DUF4935 domain-containing protein [Gammaproteobacteria bacterium]